VTYQEKVKKLIEGMGDVRGRKFDVYVAHDDWCPELQGTGKCTCDPDVELWDHKDKPILVRGYRGKELIFEDSFDLAAMTLPQYEAMEKKHCDALFDGSITLLEFENPGEPDPQKRFLRYGTSPEGMMMPIAIRLGPK
jgi:hypothetical protein